MNLSELGKLYEADKRIQARERALLEFLYSTGCRVGEVQKINIEDLNWENCSAIVNGKGSKQREVYFIIECKVWLKKYLASREDSCRALFVTDTNPTPRMAIPTMRRSLKRLAARRAETRTISPLLLASCHTHQVAVVSK